MFVTKRKYNEMVSIKDETIELLNHKVDEYKKFADEMYEVALNCLNQKVEEAKKEEEKKKEKRQRGGIIKFPTLDKEGVVDVFFLELIRKHLNAKQTDFSKMIKISTAVYGKMIFGKTCYTVEIAKNVYNFLEFLADNKMYDFNNNILNKNKTWIKFKEKYSFDYDYLMRASKK